MLGIAIVFNIIVDVMVLMFAHTFYTVYKYNEESKEFLAENKGEQ